MTAPNLVQETAIEKILEENLWKEIDLLEKAIEDLETKKEKLQERVDKLKDIAEAADIPDPKEKE